MNIQKLIAGAGGKVLSYILSEPLGGAKSVKVDINTGTGNLTVDKLTDSKQMLASGTLQYVDNQGLPTRTLDVKDGQATLALKATGMGQPWFRFPWAACNGATEWQIHLNPTVSSDITAHSGGGNVKLDLGGLIVTRVSADTGGGNVKVVLPDNADNLDVTAKTGGGNVTVEMGGGISGSHTITAISGAGNVSVAVPDGIPAKVYATSGLGKIIVDSRFSKTDDHTYQSADYDGAEDKVEITVKSGAGNVGVNKK